MPDPVDTELSISVCLWAGPLQTSLLLSLVDFCISVFLTFKSDKLSQYCFAGHLPLFNMLSTFVKAAGFGVFY